MNRGGNDDIPGSGEPDSQNYLTAAMPRPLVVRGGRALAVNGRDTLDDSQGPEINFLAYWHVLVKHRLVIAGAVALALGAIDGATLAQTRRLEFAARHGQSTGVLLPRRLDGLSAARRRWRGLTRGA